MRPILLCFTAGAALLLTGCETLNTSRQADAVSEEDRRYANLAAELGVLRERVGQLELDLSLARQETAGVRSDVETARRQPDAVSRAELNQAVGQARADIATSRRETLEQVNRSVEDLARKTNQALEQMARQVNARATTVRPAETSQPPLPADTPGQVYTVQSGDTLSAIARKFGTSMAEIRRANQLTSDTIRIGQNLFIPDKR